MTSDTQNGSVVTVVGRAIVVTVVVRTVVPVFRNPPHHWLPMPQDILWAPTELAATLSELRKIPGAGGAGDEGHVSKLTPLAATPPARRSIDLGPPDIKTMSQSGRPGQRGHWADPPTNLNSPAPSTGRMQSTG